MSNYSFMVSFLNVYSEKHEKKDIIILYYSLGVTNNVLYKIAFHPLFTLLPLDLAVSNEAR